MSGFSRLRVLALLLLCLFLFFYRLGDRDLWSSHEGRAAQDAASMVRDGYWGVPRLFDQQYDLQKPPMYYWCVAGIAWLRGEVDAVAVRLPAALAALGTVVLVLSLGGRRGWLAALLLATAVHFTWLARTGRIDMPLTFAVSVALVAFYRATRRAGSVSDRSETARTESVHLESDSSEAPKNVSGSLHSGRSRSRLAMLLVGYVALAVAVLLKGPIGLVLPGAVLAIHLLIEWRLRDSEPLRLFARSLLWGVPLLLLLVLPWFVWASGQTDGKLIRCFFWYHNIERAFGGEGGLRAHPWWFYGPRLLADLFPWGLLLPIAVIELLRTGRWRHDSAARFGLIWFGSMLVVLSLARFKRADYLLPAYPGAALVVASLLIRPMEMAAVVRKGRLVAASLLAVFVVGSIAGWAYCLEWVLPRHEPAREARTFAAEIRQLAPSPNLLIFFRAESHALAFHVGRPINTVLEWENIQVWVNRPGDHYFVMPPECAAAWPRHVPGYRLQVLATNAETEAGPHEHPLVFVRSVRVASPH